MLRRTKYQTRRVHSCLLGSKDGVTKIIRWFVPSPRSRKHPKFKSFKRNGCKHYELMAEVFARSVATGGLAISSTQMPLNSDDERLVEDEFLHSARLSSTATNTGGTRSKGKRRLDDKMNIGGNTRKNTNKKWKDKITDVLEIVSATMISKEHHRKAREKASTMSMAAATPYTMKACIEILKNMSGIPPSAITATFKHLANPNMREGFIEMPPEWQRNWVLSLK